MLRDHLSPPTLKGALDFKKRYGNQAFFLAGGTDLFINLWEGKITSEYLVDVTLIPDLCEIERIEKDHLTMGACLTANHLSRSPLVQRYAPSLSVAASQLGSPAVRNQATLGGNLVNASPAADLVPPLIAQRAFVQTVRSNGPRSFPVEELAVEVNKTCLFPDEILTGISVPILKKHEGTAYLKLGLREASTISVATIAIWLRRKEGRKEMESVRIAMGSVAPHVMRACQTEAFLIGKPFKEEVVREAVRFASQECKPISDIRATQEYRRSMIGQLVEMGLTQAWKDSSKREGGS